jgi:hypothetical protein
MEEVTGGGEKKWGMDKYSIKSIRGVVYIECRMEEMVSWGKRNIRRGELAWRISRKWQKSMIHGEINCWIHCIVDACWGSW